MAGDLQLWEGGKGHPSHHPGPERPAPTRAESSEKSLVLPPSLNCGKERGGRKEGWEGTQCFSQSVCDRKKE